MRKKIIPSLFFVLALVVISLIPLISAVTVYIDGNLRPDLRDGETLITGLTNNHAYQGQVFTADGSTITTIQLQLRKWNNPAANFAVKIETITGTYGTDGKPSGSLIGTSDSVAASTLTTSYNMINFTFSTPVSTLANTKYALYLYPVDATTLDGTNAISIGYDASSPLHSGNYFEWTGTTWYTAASVDLIFAVYGTPAASPTSAPTPTPLTGVGYHWNGTHWVQFNQVEEKTDYFANILPIFAVYLIPAVVGFLCVGKHTIGFVAGLTIGGIIAYGWGLTELWTMVVIVLVDILILVAVPRGSKGSD